MVALMENAAVTRGWPTRALICFALLYWSGTTLLVSFGYLRTVQPGASVPASVDVMDLDTAGGNANGNINENHSVETARIDFSLRRRASSTSQMMADAVKDAAATLAAAASGANGAVGTATAGTAIKGTPTVMTMVHGNVTDDEYQRFVGSLRKTGYAGNIMIVIDQDSKNFMTKDTLLYFKFRNVTDVKVVYGGDEEGANGRECTRTVDREFPLIPEDQPCVPTVSDQDDANKGHRFFWGGRSAFFRDWLRQCDACTGPVLYVKFKGTFFQLDPFAGDDVTLSNAPSELRFYEDHKNNTLNQTWSYAGEKVRECRGLNITDVLLHSDAVVASNRDAMASYFGALSHEEKFWKDQPQQCHENQDAIHNYLYRSGKLAEALKDTNTKIRVVANKDGTVNSVGAEATLIAKEHIINMRRYFHYRKPKALRTPLVQKNTTKGDRWVSEHYKLVDDDGYFVQRDLKTRSRVVIQQDEFFRHGLSDCGNWMKKRLLWFDELPISYRREMRKKFYAADRLPSPPYVPPTRTETDTGIDVTDPRLYEKVDLKGDSSTATVISMATGYDMEVYQRFIGSLRKSGFKGHIILAVDAELDPELEKYFNYRNVTFKHVEMIPYEECVKTSDSYPPIIRWQPCSKAYPHLKATWARHSLFRDWLTECETCTGPVLYIDSRDSYFQDDPFGPNTDPVEGLQVYQVGEGADTKTSFVGNAIRQCKHTMYDEPMLCAGSTVGTRAAMLTYLEIMIKELDEWINNPDCSFSDQGVHNYLYYSGQLPFAHSMENWVDGIVNTLGFIAEGVVAEHTERVQAKNATIKEADAALVPFEGANEQRWIGEHYSLVDDRGFVTRIDGKVSPVIHQFDRFKARNSYALNTWLHDNNLWWDAIPVDFIATDTAKEAAAEVKEAPVEDTEKDGSEEKEEPPVDAKEEVDASENAEEKPKIESLPPGEEFSACLMVLDENHRLPEWLAYHYYTLNLRHLVITVDPHSSTSPNHILDRWRSLIDIKVWTDSDFTSKNLHRDPKDNLEMSVYKHQTRQRTFYSACTKYHQARHRTWTTYTDADEYFTVSSDAIKDSQRRMSEPGSVMKVIQEYSDSVAPRRTDVPTAWYDRFQKTPCAMIPRVLVSAVESSKEEVANEVPSFLNATMFETLRWRYRATKRYDGIDRDIDDWGKSIMDVSRVRPEHFKDGGTAHFALKSICSHDHRMSNYSEVPVGIHHYLGSWEAFSCRDDARMGSWRHSDNKWKKRSHMKRGGADDNVRPWVAGFVDMVGEDRARTLLQDVGVLTHCKSWSKDKLAMRPLAFQQ